jgi:hypothetical protein
MSDYDRPAYFDIELTNPTARQYVDSVRQLAKVLPNGVRGDKRVNVRVHGKCLDCYPTMFEDM